MGYFPIVGLALGTATAALDWLARSIFPVPVVTVLDLTFLAVASGGLHLDGLADAADGLLSHGDRETRLAAMRDSRTGAFGVAAVGLVLLLEFSGLSSIAVVDRAVAIIGSVALSRWAMSLAVWSFPAARNDGLGAAFARQVTVLDVAMASAVIGVLAGALFALAAAAVVLLLAAAIAMMVGSFSRARVGGLTGDVYGAIGELVLACELTALCALPR